jgi:hypothetical protein
MAPHRRSDHADEPQHKAFRAMYPDIPLHVWRAPTYDALEPALARVTLAEQHDAEACERDPGRGPFGDAAQHRRVCIDMCNYMESAAHWREFADFAAVEHEGEAYAAYGPSHLLTHSQIGLKRGNVG